MLPHCKQDQTIKDPGKVGLNKQASIHLTGVYLEITVVLRVYSEKWQSQQTIPKSMNKCYEQLKYQSLKDLKTFISCLL